jgi:hypothetical protein
MTIRKEIMTLLLLVVLSFRSTDAAPPQKGPAYYTDVHGAGALVQAMHAIARFDPAYKSHRDAGVNWMLRQVREFPNEGRTWLQNPSARNGTPKYNLAITVTANYSAKALMEVYEETKDPRLLAVIDDHMAWLKQTAHQKGAKRGIDALFWTSRHEIEPTRRAAKPRPLLSGNSWGFGNVLDAFGEYYRLTKDESVLPYLEKGTRFGYLASVKTRGTSATADFRRRRGLPPQEAGGSADHFQRIHWMRGDGSVVMGFCRGCSGNVYALQTAQKLIPGATITEDHSIEDVINSGLRFLIDEAEKQNETAIWYNMNGRPGERNLGIGRGVSGIATTLWRGYEMNRELGNQEMARRCRETAEGTIRLILDEVESLDPTEPLSEYVAAQDESAGKKKVEDRSGRLVETIGICSGISGTYRWLFEYADAVRTEDPKLAKRCEEATRIVARRLVNTAFVVDGTYAWKNHNPKFGGKKVVNMAIDHGQTGVVTALAEIGWRLKDEDIMNAARKGADYVAMNLVTDGDGVKMPMLVKIDPNAKPLVARD